MTNNYPVVRTNEKMKVVVKGPEGVVFNGEVFALTSKNVSGLFDVLPFHTNFVSIIKELLLLYETKENPKEMKIENGVMMVDENIVEIFLGVETIA